MFDSIECIEYINATKKRNKNMFTENEKEEIMFLVRVATDHFARKKAAKEKYKESNDDCFKRIINKHIGKNLTRTELTRKTQFLDANTRALYVEKMLKAGVIREYLMPRYDGRGHVSHYTIINDCSEIELNSAFDKYLSS